MSSHHLFFHKSKSSVLVIAAIIILAFIAFFVIVAGIGLFAELTGPGSGGRGGITGGLCENVPEPYKTIFDQAGDKWNVQPAFIAAIFYAGEHGNSWPTFEEHAPLGTSLNPNPHNCGSGVGCIRGPMQIGEKNWPNWTRSAYGNPLPLERIEWTRDAINVAAWHLAMTGAGGNTSDLNQLRDAASKYNSGRPWSAGQAIPETAKYVPRVIAAFQKFLCSEQMGQKIAQLAKEAVGNPTDLYYHHDPRHACAAFVSTILKQAGALDRIVYSAQGLWDNTNAQVVIPKGGNLNLAVLKPGDVIYFKGTYDNGRYFTHVGVYVGNDQVVNTSTSQLRVVSDSLSNYWVRYFAGAKRF